MGRKWVEWKEVKQNLPSHPEGLNNATGVRQHRELVGVRQKPFVEPGLS